MIKLKKILKLRSVGYYKTKDEIKEKHQKRINQKVTLWDENLIVPKRLPPENDSKTTLSELKMLAKIKPNADFVESGDDIKKAFMPLVEKNDLKVTIRCIPDDLKDSGVCIFSGNESPGRVVMAKSY